MTDVVRSTAAGLAAKTNRRRFIRNFATKTFAGVAVISAGGGVSAFYRTATALGVTGQCIQPTGPGCPQYCGPSQCCSAPGRPSGCNCASGASCTSGTTHCQGYANTWGGNSCWSCTSDRYGCGPVGCTCTTTTTCCDCQTSGCGDASGHCIGWSKSQSIPRCAQPVA